MSKIREVEEFKQFLENKHPDVSIKNKGDQTHWLHIFILWLGSIFIKNFDTGYATTIGRTIYMPKGADTSLSTARMYILARHEMVHVIDYKRYGLWFLISYAIILPCVLTMRARWEIRAYTQTLLATYEIMSKSQWGKYRDTKIEQVSKQFWSPAYFWMLPFKGHVRRKFNKICDQIEAGQIKGYSP